ncbi:HNH endonuclease [Paenibacillus sp. FSL H7-0714]|uniref:HNH endonuclease n=1 Tax=Paenibacillus sp. FSL H7-0714 TaxID=2954735 RepID=UPI0030F963C6
MANINGRQLRDRLTRLLPDRTYLTRKNFLLDAEKNFFNKCAYCNQELPLTREHVVSNMEGGTMELANIIPACRGCNDDKRETPWREYAQKKNSQFIEVIEKKIQGYNPLDLVDIRKMTDPAIKNAFDKYDARIREIDNMRKMKHSARNVSKLKKA